MKKSLLIVGAGMSGMMAALEAHRRGIDFLLVEKSKTLPQAKLHYLNKDLGEFLPFPLKEVDVHKNIYYQGEFHSSYTLPMLNAYALRTTGKLVENSIKFINGKIEKGFVPTAGIENISEELFKCLPAERIRLGDGLRALESGQAVLESGEEIDYDRMISTMPLPMMLNLIEEPCAELKFLPLEMVEVSVVKENGEKLFEQDLYHIVYICDGLKFCARFSILGQRMVLEFGDTSPTPEEFEEIKPFFEHFFLQLIDAPVKLKFSYERTVNPWGRFIVLDEKLRSELMSKLEKFDIAPLGRYATFLYKRTDIVVEDIKKLFL